MEENDHIEQTLSKIKAAEPSPFLLTRIESKIQAVTNSTISIKQVLLGSTFVGVLIIINLIVLNSNSVSNSEQTSNLLEALNMETSNHLYYE